MPFIHYHKAIQGDGDILWHYIKADSAVISRVAVAASLDNEQPEVAFLCDVELRLQESVYILLKVLDVGFSE